MFPLDPEKPGLDINGNGKMDAVDFALLSEIEKDINSRRNKANDPSGCCATLFFLCSSALLGVSGLVVFIL